MSPLDAPVIPELGPLLGRLAAPPASRRDQAGIPLDDIRLALATELFELAGAAREFAASGDVAGGISSLARHEWLGAWDHAVNAAAARIADRIDAQLRSAGAESRLPSRRLRRQLLSEDERRGIAVRIGSGGGGLVVALDALDAAARQATRNPRGLDAWRDALAAVARRLEKAWIDLESAVRQEESAWQEDIARLRAWRRPRWPLWAITAAVLGAAAYFGLILGGYIPAPGPLRPLAEAWWERL